MATKKEKSVRELIESVTNFDGVSAISAEPDFYISSGNYIVNKTTAGSYTKGIAAQGRISAIGGKSGAGKSFMAANVVKQAQLDGFGVLVLDSENALDEGFLERIGVDVDAPNFIYRGVNTISTAVEILSKFLSMVKDGKIEGRWFVLIDSLDMLMTDSAAAKFEKGDTNNDMGQAARQLKSMLVPIMHQIKTLPVAILCTKQVYVEQDPIKKMRNPYVFTEALRFIFSNIAMIIPLVLKDSNSQLNGVIIKYFVDKTRYCRPFQHVQIEVPYDDGMNPYSGLLEAAVALGVVEQNKAWYSIDGISFQKNDQSHYPKILEKLIELEKKGLSKDITTGPSVGSEEVVFMDVD